MLSSDASKVVSAQANLADDDTEGEWKFGDASADKCHVVLSGYTSHRQERYAKLRLKRDFLAACNLLGLIPPGDAPLAYAV